MIFLRTGFWVSVFLELLDFETWWWCHTLSRFWLNTQCPKFQRRTIPPTKPHSLIAFDWLRPLSGWIIDLNRWRRLICGWAVISIDAFLLYLPFTLVASHYFGVCTDFTLPMEWDDLGSGFCDTVPLDCWSGGDGKLMTYLMLTQGDTSRCSIGSVNMKTKVAIYATYTKTHLLI